MYKPDHEYEELELALEAELERCGRDEALERLRGDLEFEEASKLR